MLVTKGNYNWVVTKSPQAHQHNKHKTMKLTAALCMFSMIFDAIINMEAATNTTVIVFWMAFALIWIAILYVFVGHYDVIEK